MMSRRQEYLARWHKVPPEQCPTDVVEHRLASWKSQRGENKIPDEMVDRLVCYLEQIITERRTTK